jgi:DNA-binding transcriptional ArsR family regulator
VILLRERARSITDLAEQLGLPKGTVGHHVKVLETAGLLRVVRTRRVRAVTEKYYGRTARLFLYESTDAANADDVRNIVAASLRVAADEILPLPPDSDDPGCSGVIRTRLNRADAERFNRRLDKLMLEFRAAEDPSGEPYGLAMAMYRRNENA